MDFNESEFDGLDGDKKIIARAQRFLQTQSDIESENRTLAMDDLRFRYGEQYTAQILNARGSDRPNMVVNLTDAYCRQVTNNQRQQRPRIKVHPVDSVADPKVADVISGLIRHIEVNSDAERAYDTAFDHAVTFGFGFWQLCTEYERENSFDQEIYIRMIENPFSVYIDGTMPDGSDSEHGIITDKMSREEFKLKFPHADMAGFNVYGVGDPFTAEWVTKDEIRIAEYFYVEKKKEKLFLLSDKQVAWANDFPEGSKPQKGLEVAPGVFIVGERQSYRRYIKWAKITAAEVLEKRDIPGRWIPIVPMYGTTVLMEAKRSRFGLVRMAKDPQRMLNYWKNSATESIALAPKAKWLMVEGQDEGFENEWSQANTSNKPLLHYVRKLEDMDAPAPQRLQPEPIPPGLVQSMEAASNDLRAVLGVVDPAMRISGNVSGKALNAERQQSDNSTFHYFDNLTASIAFTGRIILSQIPVVYDVDRTIRIIGEDGIPKQETVNQPEIKQVQQPDGTIIAVQKVLNDLTVGTYDVVMDTGPGYISKRQEAVEVFTQMLGTPLGEKIAQVADDVIVRQMDVPGADIIADRLAAANPLSKIDEKSDVPPQAQMQMQAMQQQIQQMQQALQAAEQEIKMRQSIEQMRQDGATKRELLKANAAIHIEDQENQAWMRDVDQKEATRRHDTVIRSQTALSVAEINAFRELLKTRVNNAHDLVKLESKGNEEESEVAQTY